MENLIFSLNATMPVFLMMVLGYVFHKIGWISDAFADQMNRFVFLVPLPVKLFEDLATVDFREMWDTKFVVFCFLATLLSICAAGAISLLFKDRSIRGEFIQASYRSSAAILGIALITNIYGNSGLVPLMIIGSVPLYNIMAVLVLSFTQPETGDAADRPGITGTVKSILTNPILIGIAAGLVWSAFSLPLPSVCGDVISGIGATASPLGLMAMGASFEFSKAAGKMKGAFAAAFLKLVGFAALFLPAAIRLGYRDEALVSILIMLGSATTVSCYVMCRSMGHEGTLTSNTVMLTTVLSAFTLTMWLFILRSLGLV